MRAARRTTRVGSVWIAIKTHLSRLEHLSPSRCVSRSRYRRDKSKTIMTRVFLETLMDRSGRVSFNLVFNLLSNQVRISASLNLSINERDMKWKNLQR